MPAHTIADAHRQIAAEHGSRPAISLEGEVLLDHAGLADKAARIASGLIARGLAPGDRVGLVLGLSVEFYPLLLGIWTAGLTAVPIAPMIPPPDLASILRHAGAKLAVVEPPLAAPLGQTLAGEGPELLTPEQGASELASHPPCTTPREHPEGEAGTAWLFHTSGTTGRPKGVELSHQNLAALVAGYADEVDQPGPEDCILHLTPLSHGSGMAGLPHLLGGTNQVLPGARGLPNLPGVVELIERWPRTALVLPPVVVDLLARQVAELGPERVASIRAVLYGSSPMFPQVAARAMDVFGPKLVQLYGLGEAPMSVILGREDHQELLAAGHSGPLPVGRARSGIELRVIDDEGRDCAPERVGQVLLRGASITRGYLDAPEATAKVLREGWLHTGDLGWLDAQGRLYVVGRARDTVHTAAGPVYPQTLELHLLDHPAVAEAAIIGRPSEAGHEEPIAFVGLDPQAPSVDEAALAAHCSTLPEHAQPRRFTIVDKLPRNGSGKILKRVLRERA